MVYKFLSSRTLQIHLISRDVPLIYNSFGKMCYWYCGYIHKYFLSVRLIGCGMKSNAPPWLISNVIPWPDITETAELVFTMLRTQPGHPTFFRANHKTSSEQNNWSSFISDPITNERLNTAKNVCISINEKVTKYLLKGAKNFQH